MAQVRRVLSILPLTLLVLALGTTPALAAEAQYTGTFQGLAIAMGAGVVLGAVFFMMLPAGDHDEHDDHH